MEPTAEPLDEIMLWPDVKRAVKLSRVTVYHLRRAGDFPQPVKLSPNRCGWRASELRQWLESRTRATV